MKHEISAIVVDDEQDSREVLIRLLSRYHPHVSIVGEAHSVDSAYELIKTKKPTLVFLDIQMSRASGFTLLKLYTSVPFEVIFVTSYDQYAISAIRFNALDYLVKPVELSDLSNAIKKATDRIRNRSDNQFRIVNLLHAIEEEQACKIVTIHTGDKVAILKSNTIVSIAAQGRYCELTTQDATTITTARHLKEFEDYFGEQTTFIRISKSMLINSVFIRDYTKGELCIIRMTNGNTYEVARRKKQEILEKLKMK